MAPVEAHLEVVPSATAERKATVPSSAISVKNVLFATDFSASSEAALPYAAAICRHFGSTLHLAHVLSETSMLLVTGGVDYVSMGTIYEDAQAEAKEKLHEIAQRLEGIPLRSYVRYGQVWRNLNGIIQDNEVDMHDCPRDAWPHRPGQIAAGLGGGRHSATRFVPGVDRGTESFRTCQASGVS